MALVFRPPQRRLPTGQLRIDRRLMPRGLKIFSANGTTEFDDLVSGNAPIVSGFPRSIVTPEGIAFDPTPAGSVTPIDGLYYPLSGTGPAQCSVELLVHINASIVSQQASFSRMTNGVGSDGAFDRDIGVDGSGTGFYWYIFDGGTKSVSSVVPSPGIYHLVGTSDGSTIKLYVNGVLAASTAASAAYSGYTSGSMTYSQGYGYSSSRGGKVECLFPILYMGFADVAWTADEVFQRYADPYAFLIPAEAEMPSIFLPSAGGSFLAAWARNSNLPVIGTGNY